MTIGELKEKIIQSSQKKKFMAFVSDVISSDEKRFFVAPLYFPDSSLFIGNVIEIRESDAPLGKKFGLMERVEAYGNLRNVLLHLSAEPVLLCLFPNFSIMDGVAVSEFPVVEINGQSIDSFFDKIDREMDFLHVFLCATPDLKKGVFFDVCAGDPEISGSDAPIYDIYVWGVEKWLI